MMLFFSSLALFAWRNKMQRSKSYGYAVALQNSWIKPRNTALGLVAREQFGAAEDT